MFTRISRSGGRAYLQLVESYRNEEGQPRQRVIANFGRLDKLSSKDLDPLIDGLQRALGRSTSTPRVLPPSSRATSGVPSLYCLFHERIADQRRVPFYPLQIRHPRN